MDVDEERRQAGRAIAKRRDALGLSQQKLAEATGVRKLKQSYIKRIEDGGFSRYRTIVENTLAKLEQERGTPRAAPPDAKPPATGSLDEERLTGVLTTLAQELSDLEPLETEELIQIVLSISRQRPVSTEGVTPRQEARIESAYAIRRLFGPKHS